MKTLEEVIGHFRKVRLLDGRHNCELGTVISIRGDEVLVKVGDILGHQGVLIYRDKKSLQILESES